MKKILISFLTLSALLFPLSVKSDSGVISSPPYTGPQIEFGTANGQLLFYDNVLQKYIHTEIDELFWDDILKRFRPVFLWTPNFAVIDNSNNFYSFIIAESDDGLQIGIDSTDGLANRNVIYTTLSNLGKKHGLNTLSPDVNICTFSSADVDVPANKLKRGCFTHDGTQFVLSEGQGNGIKVDDLLEAAEKLDVTTTVSGVSVLQRWIDNNGNEIGAFSKNGGNSPTLELKIPGGATRIKFDIDGDSYVNPTVGGFAVGATSTADKFLVSGGAATFAGRVKKSQGSNVASANNITLGTGTSGGNYYQVTGTTSVQTISSSGWTPGSEVILEAVAGLTFEHNTAGTGASILLEGGLDYNCPAGGILKIFFNGLVWKEIDRGTY